MFGAEQQPSGFGRLVGRLARHLRDTVLRRMALNLAWDEPSNGLIRGKLKRAGWQDEFMLDLIRAV